jgi:hypothetical protein
VTEAIHHRAGNGLKRAKGRLRREQPSATQTGAAVFPHLVWVHYQWERRLHSDGIADEALEQIYQGKLAEFQREQGKVEQVYWSTRTASAVAMTVKRGSKPRGDPLRLRERQDIVRFHRVTDWVTRDSPMVADLLNECDLLASRVEQVLRGTSQRIAMRWILGIAMHLLGFLERDASASDRRSEERQFVRAQRAKLAEVDAYYRRAASQAGRVIYVSGMLIGLLLVAILGVLAAWLLGTTDMSPHHRKLVLLCYGAGAIGALVSTISRMGKPEAGKFNVDFELGRPLIRRLGVFRPFLGAIFGVAFFFLLASGLLDLKPGPGLEPYYYGIAAFLAGFSERFATGMLGAAEHKLEPTPVPGAEQPDSPAEAPVHARAHPPKDGGPS